MAEAGSAARQEFQEPGKFPDPESEEVNLDGEEEVEIELVDDAPLEDQGREARPAADKLDPDSEAFQEEVRSYSENAQKRIGELTHNYHDERRNKETAQRESVEATRFAQQVQQENEALKTNLHSNNAVLIEQFDARSDAELETARVAYKEAYESGDTDNLLQAQENIARITAERVNRPRRVSPPQPPQQSQQVLQPVQTPDRRFVEWSRDNSWFQAPGNEDMTGYAIGLHQKLVGEGLNPLVDETYYQRIDQGMKTVFPDRVATGDLGGSGESRPRVVTHSKKPPVGGPSRGGQPPRKVQLTSSQVALAKRLGLTNKQYAAQVYKEQRADG